MESFPNYTILCPPQSDSPLSVAASWIGIVTFITTTLGGVTIFFTIYKAFKKAQEDVLEYGKATSLSTKELIADIETMEPMLQRLAHGSRLLANAMELLVQIRELTNRLDSIIKPGTPRGKGIKKAVANYRLSQDPELANTIREIQRLAPSLQAMKMNMLLMRFEENDQLLHKLADVMKTQAANGAVNDATWDQAS